jgi:type IV secretion system protein TrbL
MLFRGYNILYSSGSLVPQTPFFRFVIATSLPVIALYISWKTFRFAAPLTAKALGGATNGAALVGGVAAGTYLGSAGVAKTASRWGPKAAAGHAVAETATGWKSNDTDDGNQPAYRRTENDPSADGSNSGNEDRGMEFDRGIH